MLGQQYDAYVTPADKKMVTSEIMVFGPPVLSTLDLMIWATVSVA